jgi:hypothetical protein
MVEKGWWGSKATQSCGCTTRLAALEWARMPRPSQYSRGRRAVMQVTLALVLAATLGLASLLARGRERTLAVELSSDPIELDVLNVRLPKSWASKQIKTQLSSTVLATEQLPAEQRDRREPRLAVIRAMPTSSNDPADVLRQTLSDTRGRPGKVSQFQLLGQSGLLLRYDTYKPIPDDPFGRYTPVPGWFAAAVVPGAGGHAKPLGIVIGVEGYDTAGPAGRRLVRQLADGVSLQR